MFPKIIFGLRYSRLLEWFKVMKLELDEMSWKDKYKLFKALTRLAIHRMFKPLPKELVRRRYKTCQQCIVFDPENKRCRNGEYGCGCYTPYLVVASDKPCWGRERNSKRGWE
jgi:hypothetical protein